MHWRWPAYLSGPTFRSGAPLIPSGSQQTVDLGVVRYRPGPEEHPAGDFQTLIDGESLVDATSLLGNQPVAFWYVGTGYQADDSFFTHGLFFSPSGPALPPMTGQIVKAGIRFNRALQTWGQTLQIFNVSSAPIVGPLFVALDSLSPDETLYNATGTTRYTSPVGSPYVPVDLGGDEAAQLAPGASASVNLMFSNPTKAGITYNARLIVGGMP